MTKTLGNRHVQPPDFTAKLWLPDFKHSHEVLPNVSSEIILQFPGNPACRGLQPTLGE
jgi:hypothetical protein